MSIARIVITLPILVTTVLVNQEQNRQHQFNVYDQDGITITESIGGPKYSNELFTYTHIVTLRQDQSDPESLLFRPHARYVMDEAGHFYVADVGNHRIAVFDQSGNYIRDFGRQGEGPGEFLSLQILTLNGNILSVWDTRQRRTTLFSTTGELLNTYSLPNVAVSSHDKLYITPSGLHFFLTHIYHEDPLKRDWHGWQGTTFTPSGDTLAVITTPIVKTIIGGPHALDSLATSLRWTPRV